MKGFIKLLPVAFGALVMASCSNNDFLGLNDQVEEYQLKEGEILVTVDEETDATRASIGEATKEESGIFNMYRSVFWREGDMIKVYDATKWRPQYFKYTDNLDGVKNYAKNAAGPIPAVFTLDAATSPSGTETTQYESGYAVFPGKKFSVFQGEERDALTFDYTSMRYWGWDALTTNYFTETGDGKSWYTEFPMWGNVDQSKLALKYLTGFLRIDLSGYKEIGAETRASLVIQASKQLAGMFKAENFNYEAKRAPLLVGTSEEAGYADLAAIQTYNTIKNPNTRTQLETDKKSDFTMVINLPVADLKANQGDITKDVKKHNVFFIPVPVALKDYVTEVINGRTYNKFQTNGLPDEGAAADPYAIRVALVYDNGAVDDDITINPAMFNAGTPGDVLFESEAFNEIDKAGRFYNIDCINAPEVNTPYQLAELIKDLDKIGRKVTVSLNNAPVVKGNKTPQDQNLYIGQLNHDITINFPAGIIKSASADDNKDHYPTLYISKSGTGKLTLNFNGGDPTNYPAICIRDNGDDNGTWTKIKSSKVESEIVIDGTIELPKVHVATAANLVTLKAAAKNVTLAGKMTVDALDKKIAALHARGNNSELALKNGTITELLTLYANTFTCNSEGKSFIKEIACPTSASENNDWELATPTGEWVKNGADVYKNQYNNVILNSVWDGVKYTYNATPALATETDFEQQEDIHTAAQFSMGNYVAVAAKRNASVLHTNLTIGANEGATAAQKNWRGNQLTVSFEGLGKRVNLTSTNNTGFGGLFSTVKLAAEGTIKDLNIKADIQPSSATTRIGGLAGGIWEDSKKVTVYNVNLLEGSKLGFFSESPSYKLEPYTESNGIKVGGLFGTMYGKTEAEIIACSVKGQIAGFACLGGFIGRVAEECTVTFGKQSKEAFNYKDAFEDTHDVAAYGTPTSEVTFLETRTIPNNLYNTGYGTIGMFVGDVYTKKASTITIENASTASTSAIAINDKIKGNESALKFNKNHYKVGVDANGNDKYYNYFGSTFNVVGYCAIADAAKMPTIKIGQGYNTTTASYVYMTLSDCKEDKAENVNNYYNWFKPWGE